MSRVFYHINWDPLNPLLRIWNKKIFGNGHANVTKAANELSKMHGLVDEIGYIDLLDQEEKKAQSFIDQAIHIEDRFWMNKMGNKWFIKGGREH